MSDYVTNTTTRVLKESVTSYRRGHNTMIVMLAMRDDIHRAMKRGEVTIAVLANFWKAFDTVSYPTILRKPHRQRLSKDYLKWVTNYLTGRQQFVQIDDAMSSTTNVSFGVPQGSILGPIVSQLTSNLVKITYSPILINSRTGPIPTTLFSTIKKTKLCYFQPPSSPMSIELKNILSTTLLMVSS